jgi:uncharacterized membrane protein
MFSQQTLQLYDSTSRFCKLAKAVGGLPAKAEFMLLPSNSVAARKSRIVTLHRVILVFSHDSHSSSCLIFATFLILPAIRYETNSELDKIVFWVGTHLLHLIFRKAPAPHL